MSSLRARVLLVGFLSLLGAQPQAQEVIRDYYAEPGLNPFKETLNQSINEHIDVPPV